MSSGRPRAARRRPLPQLRAATAAVRLSLKLPGQDFFVLASRWGRIGTPAVAPESMAAELPTPGPEAAP